MKIIADTLKYAVLVLFVIALFQVVVSFSVYQDWYKVRVGQSLGEVHAILGKPDQEETKSGPVDLWSSNILLGGIKLRVTYTDDCQARHSGCKVGRLHKQYFTLWDNRWFLYFSLG